MILCYCKFQNMQNSLISVYSNLKHGFEDNTMAKNIIYTKSKLLQRSDVLNTD